MYDNIPNIDSVIEYKKGDILISNIRPYLKKIWLADKDGGCSPDVIVIRTSDVNVNSKYLYLLLKRDVFFDWVMSDVKGVKMPRGKKENIEKFRVHIPSIKEQNKIISQIEKLEMQIKDLQSIIDSVQDKKNEILKKELLA